METEELSEETESKEGLISNRKGKRWKVRHSKKTNVKSANRRKVIKNPTVTKKSRKSNSTKREKHK